MNKDNKHSGTSPHQEKVWQFYNMLPKTQVWYNGDIVEFANNELSLSRATTYRYLKLLKDKQLIIVIGRGKSKVNSNEIIKDDIDPKSIVTNYNQKIRGRKTFVKKRYS